MISKFIHSFRWQMSLSVILLILVIGLGSLFYLRYQQQSFIKTNLQHQGEAISYLLAEDIAKLVYLDDPDVAATITYNIKSIPELQSALIFNSENQPILKIKSDRQNTSGDESVTILTGIFYEKIPLGSAKFSFHSPELSQEQRKAEDLFIALIVLLFILSVLFVVYLDKKFFARLSELSHALKHAAEHKDFSKRLRVNKKDEIGQTSEHFNQLVDMVEDKTRNLSFQANHDNLTNLYNRNQLLSCLDSMLQERPQQGFHAVGYLDLDQFKVVNDTCGHTAGDELLKQLSELMLEILTEYPETAVGRFGGDEFLVLMKALPEEKINLIFQTLQQGVHDFKFYFLEREFPVGMSIGCVLFNDEITTNSELVSAADAACYQVKNEGSGLCRIHHLHDPSLQDYQKAMGWVSRLYKALDEDDFELYFQPIVNARNPGEKFDHFETLIRLQNKGEVISPMVFIPIAERYGLCKKIDLWVIEDLCHTLHLNPSFLEQLELVSINFSALSIVDKSVIPAIDAIVQHYKIPYNKLCFEITETAVISQLKKARVFIRFFRNKGVKFSLDDFGSGMASFGYLSQLEVNFLKIDGSFIRDMNASRIAREMVGAMINIGKITDKKIVAEQVEDEKVSELLIEMGADYMQGYYFARPAPMKNFIQRELTQDVRKTGVKKSRFNFQAKTDLSMN